MQSISESFLAGIHMMPQERFEAVRWQNSSRAWRLLMTMLLLLSKAVQT